MAHFEKIETLDPENWEEFRSLGYKMIDNIIYSLKNDTSFEYKFPSDEILSHIYQPLTDRGEGEKETYRLFKEYIEPYPMGKWFIRSNFWGWVVGSGAPYGSLIQMLMAHLICSGEQEGVDIHVHK